MITSSLFIYLYNIILSSIFMILKFLNDIEYYLQKVWYNWFFQYLHFAKKKKKNKYAFEKCLAVQSTYIKNT